MTYRIMEFSWDSNNNKWTDSSTIYESKSYNDAKYTFWDVVMNRNYLASEWMIFILIQIDELGVIKHLIEVKKRKER